ncbi:anti-sigma factor [Bacillus sp. FJAT-21945]|nr:anti-sigma factor [Bacillus sp. FJAT-21945]
MNYKMEMILMKKGYKWLIGLTTAAAIFTASVNTSASFAKTLSDVPVVGTMVKGVTFTAEGKDVNAQLQVPKIESLENKELESSLNQKYLAENQKLYDEFKKEVNEIKEKGNGHLSVNSGYEVKTDDELIFSIGRYTDKAKGSSSTTMKYDTIDKKEQVLLTLPILFKNNDYIADISENIKSQMKEQMKKDSNKVYWVNDGGIEDINIVDKFKQISADQNFYINKDHKLVISFDEYEVAPGYMGIVEFVIPTEVISKDLVGHNYIK